MFDLVLIIFFVVMACRIIIGISREGAIFREFNQSRTLAFLVLLFPVGPLILLVGLSRLPILVTFVAAAACYLPALLIAHRCDRALATAGTDKVQKAQASISQASGAALVGLIYVSVVIGFSVVVPFLDN